jgi:hypothetical protein
MHRVFHVLVFVPMLVSAAAFGQVTKIANPMDFSTSSIRLDFQELSENSDARRLFTQWGISLAGADGCLPRVKALPPPLPLPNAIFNKVIFNEPASGGSSANVPLIIDFRHPVSRVGFVLGNGEAGTNVAIKAYDSIGNSLGTVNQNGLAQETFVGVATSSARGISKVTVSYGSAAAAEQIDDLIFQYMERPRFNTYFAQVADWAGALHIQTMVVVSNLSNSTAEGELRFLESVVTTGPKPMSVRIDGVQASTFPFTIPPFSSKIFNTGGVSSEPKIGYAAIDSSVPVEGTAIFQYLGAGGAVTKEAGISAAVGQSMLVGPAQRIQVTGLNSGVAVINTSATQPLDARIALVDEDGYEIASNEAYLDLGPGGHRAAYLDEIFGSQAPADFKGTVIITGSQPMAMVILRTDPQGNLSSTLPVGGLER